MIARHDLPKLKRFRARGILACRTAREGHGRGVIATEPSKVTRSEQAELWKTCKSDHSSSFGVAWERKNQSLNGTERKLAINVATTNELALKLPGWHDVGLAASKPERSHHRPQACEGFVLLRRFKNTSYRRASRQPYLDEVQIVRAGVFLVLRYPFERETTQTFPPKCRYLYIISCARMPEQT